MLVSIMHKHIHDGYILDACFQDSHIHVSMMHGPCIAWTYDAYICDVCMCVWCMYVWSLYDAHISDPDPGSLYMHVSMMRISVMQLKFCYGRTDKAILGVGWYVHPWSMFQGCIHVTLIHDAHMQCMVHVHVMHISISPHDLDACVFGHIPLILDPCVSTYDECVCGAYIYDLWPWLLWIYLWFLIHDPDAYMHIHNANIPDPWHWCIYLLCGKFCDGRTDQRISRF